MVALCLHTLYDSGVVILCDGWYMEGRVFRLVVFEAGVVVRSVVNQSGSVGMRVLWSVVYAPSQSYCNNVVDPKEIANEILKSHMDSWCLFAPS